MAGLAFHCSAYFASTSGVSWAGSKVTVSYPFSFMVLQPVANLVVKGSLAGKAFTMSAVAEMRNEQ